MTVINLQRCRQVGLCESTSRPAQHAPARRAFAADGLRHSSSGSSSRKGRHVAHAEKEEDLWQFPDRQQWYEAKFVAVDQPEWTPARFVSSRVIAPGKKEVMLEVEVSREKVAIRNAYKHVGQRCSVRVNGGVLCTLTTSTPPPPQSVQQDVMFKIRGDIFAGEKKMLKDDISVMVPMCFVVDEGRECEDVWKLEEGDSVEVGPWQGGGVDFRGPIAAIYRYPTVIMMCSGNGIATARALIEAPHDAPSLLTTMRDDARLYYLAPNESSILYKDLFEVWEEKYKVKTFATTKSFFDAFDDDDELVYDPATTAAVILTCGDADALKQAQQVCKEAEITCIVTDEDEQTPSEYLPSITMPAVKGVKSL